MADGGTAPLFRERIEIFYEEALFWGSADRGHGRAGARAVDHFRARRRHGRELQVLRDSHTTGAPVDLASPQIALRRFANGGSTPFAINLTGVIPAGGFFTAATNNTDFFNVYGFNPDFVNTNITPNGDDSFELFDTVGMTVLDSFGGDWIGSGTSGGSDAVRSASNGLFFRRADMLPNNGNWGGPNNVAPIADMANSPSGFWYKRTLTANGDATALGTPGAGGAEGIEIPVEISAFGLE